MNNKIIFSILMTPLLLRATPPQEGKPTSFQGGTQGLPWLIGGAMVAGGGYWAYNQWYSPKAKFRYATLALNDCIKDNTSCSMNRYGFPPECEDALIKFTLAREALNDRQGIPTVQGMINSFKN